jgi:inosine/xanthosine triphosphatase
MPENIYIASTNPVKINAVKQGFESVFPGKEFTFSGVKFQSPVSAQPFGDEEIRTGAMDRAKIVRGLHPDGSYWVGIEGGVEIDRDEMLVYAWIVILSKDREGKARSAAFYVPPRIAELVTGGKELGDADDIVFGRSNSKQGNGAVGILTGDLVDREALYQQPVVLALIPFMNPELFPISS